MELENINVTEVKDKELLNDFNYSSEVLDAVRAYLIEIGKYKIYDSEELKNLIIRYKNGEENLRDTIINSNLRLVVFIAKKLKKFKNSEDFLDFIQEGNLGLLIALEKFEPSLGYAFSTYAVYWIKQKIDSYYYINMNSIRIPVKIYLLINKYRIFRDNYKKSYQKEPTREEIKNELKVNDSTLDNILIASDIHGNVASLNKVVDDEDRTKSEVGDFVPDYDHGFKEIEDKYNDTILLVNLKNYLSALEYYVIYYRYIKQPRMLLEEIAYEFLLTRERIRKVEVKSLKKSKKIIINNKKEKNIDYDIAYEELIPMPYKKRVILYYLKKQLNSFDYCLLYNFIYNNYDVEEYFNCEEAQLIKRRVNCLKKQYECLFSDYEEYKKIYLSLGEVSKNEIFDSNIKPINIKDFIVKEYLSSNGELKEYINTKNIENSEIIANVSPNNEIIILKRKNL